MNAKKVYRILPLVLTTTMFLSAATAGTLEEAALAPGTAPTTPALRAGEVAVTGSIAVADWSKFDTAVPEDVRVAITDTLQAKVGKLLEEKNEEKVAYKRGSFSKSFRRVDDDTYTVSFTVDTATAGSMKSERYLVTLKRDASDRKKWTVAKEDLQDTYTDLYRRTINDISFSKFESVNFEKEGMKVTGGKGSLYKAFRAGKLDGFTVMAKDLNYIYAPPMHLHQKLWEKFRKDHPDDVIFKPGYIRVSCDPVTCDQLMKSMFTGMEDATADTVDAPLKGRYTDAASDYKKSLNEDYFKSFGQLYEPDRRAWRLELGKSFFDPGLPGNAVAIGSDSYDPKEVTFGVYGIFESFQFWGQPLYAYYSEETRNSNISPIELERRDDFEQRDYDLVSVHGTVTMGVDDAELMTADLTFGMKTKRPVSKIRFAIDQLNAERPDAKEAKAPRMTVNSVQDGEGNELTFVKLSSSYGYIILPKPLPAGADLVLRTQFEDKEVLYKVTPSYSYVSRGGWLPFVHFGDMIHDMDLTVRVPEKYQTLGIGTKVSEEVKDGVRVTRWIPRSPVDFPTVIFGDYYKVESKVVAKKLDGTVIPVVAYMDKTTWGDWEISEKSLLSFADRGATAINLYTAIYGQDYPYDKLDLVDDPAPALYGQAPSSIIYLGVIGFKKSLLSSLGGGGGYTSAFIETLVAHETAHQWWGSLIGNANQGNYWFVESLAEWSSALYDENANGKEKYLEHVAEWRREILNTDMEVSVQDAAELWGGDDFGAYRAAVYSKGPYAFYTLRTMFGDEKFFKFMKDLAGELKGKEIVTRDIQMAAEKSFGGNMEWFFDQWLRGVGLPEFTFSYSVHPTEDGKYLIEGTIEQRTLLGKDKEVIDGPPFRGKVPIMVTSKSGKETPVLVLVDGPKSTFKIKFPENPVEVVFNKYHETLAYDVINAK